MQRYDDKYFLAFRQSGTSAEQKLFVRAIDQDGKVYRGWHAGSINGIQVYNFDLPERAKKVGIEIISQPRRRFEFFLKPPPPKVADRK